MIIRAATILVFIILTTQTTLAFAAESSPSEVAAVGQEVTATENSDEDITTLKQVTVVGQSEDPLTGKNTLNRDQLDYLPTKNGSINEAISILPGVQQLEQGRASTQGGEIRPPNLVISGSKAYQNNFMVDGINNNSLLDPLQTDTTGFLYVPGHPQALSLDTSLIDGIKVYRYNIPVAYGSFTGGVVDATTRNPEPEFWGEVNYRTTRDEWTDFHIDRELLEDFENSNETKYQPDFEKHDGGFIVNLPLSKTLSLLTAYQINYSEIPLQHLDSTKSQKRRNENFLLKLAWDIDAFSRLTTTLNYSPYKGDYFYKNSQNSNFEIEGGGYQASLSYDRATPVGEFHLLTALKGSKNDRDAPQNLSGWLANIDGEPSSKPWGNLVGTSFRGEIVSQEGSVGSLESRQNGFQLKADFLTKPVPLAKTSHQVNVGIDYEQVHGTLDRDEEANQYIINSNPGVNNANPNIICPANSVDCIDGEQLFLTRFHYPADSTSATINFLDVYIDDRIQWQRLEIRPGLRISYDDYMENTNFAPRLAASYDTFGSGKTLLIGGWNRYYGRTLLTYKLREASPGSHFQTRGVINTAEGDLPETWPEYSSPSTMYRYSAADTPYTNETVLGLNQELWGGRLKLTWVHRNGKDEFTREKSEKQDDGKSYYELTNYGESEYDEYSLEWGRSWQKHFLSINATYQKTTMSDNESYVDTFDQDDLYDEVWYEGKLTAKTDLRRKDYSRPWVVNLVYSTQLPWGITFTNVTKYRSGYEGLDSLSVSEKIALGIPKATTAYIDNRFPGAWVFDWQVDWDVPFIKGQKLVTTLEINNVFNEKVQLGDGGTVSDTDPANYELGRQFWLGMTYKF